MKLITLNTHSHLEENYDEKCQIFVNAILELKPDVIALQEVNQSQNADICLSDMCISPKESVVLKKDNHALKTVSLLKEFGLTYYFSYLGFKNGYKKYDEGLAVLSLRPIEEVQAILLSKNSDYFDWKTRMALNVKINGINFCSTHMGWWNDSEEPFEKQFKKLNKALEEYKSVFLMGDFNSPDSIKNEGYDMICSLGWNDTYCDAKSKDNGFTVFGDIAGWNGSSDNKRIDYIFTKHKADIESSRVIFDGNYYKKVSDHFGVITEIKGCI